MFGPVASDPAVSRLVTALAADIDVALPAIRAARAAARARAWRRRRLLGGQPGSQDGGQAIVDLDAKLVRADSDKEGAEPTYKRDLGFSLMCAFVDHGEHGRVETLVVELRRGRVSAFDVTTHVDVVNQALEQLSRSSGVRYWSAPIPPLLQNSPASTQ